VSLRWCLVSSLLLAFSAGFAQNTTTKQKPSTVPAITLTEHDNGKEVDLSTGGVLIVKLASTPSTGYDWALAADPAPLKLQKSTFHAKAAGANMAGAGGTTVFRLMASSSGMTTLTFVYRRAWEYNVPPMKTFSVRVNVR
jgi:inhibitor of cysteine peptidase